MHVRYGVLPCDVCVLAGVDLVAVRDLVIGDMHQDSRAIAKALRGI